MSLRELKERAFQNEEVKHEYDALDEEIVMECTCQKYNCGRHFTYCPLSQDYLPKTDEIKMSKIRYAVWGHNHTYKWLWLASLVAGIDAFKQRYNKRTAHDEIKR